MRKKQKNSTRVPNLYKKASLKERLRAQEAQCSNWCDVCGYPMENDGHATYCNRCADAAGVGKGPPVNHAKREMKFIDKIIGPMEPVSYTHLRAHETPE